MAMKSHEELASLVAELLERFGVMELSPIDPDEMDASEYVDRMGGCEGYSMDFSANTYILFPDDVQDLLLLLASAIYSDEYEEDAYFDEEE
jgi:hypothetical protein